MAAKDPVSPDSGGSHPTGAVDKTEAFFRSWTHRLRPYAGYILIFLLAIAAFANSALNEYTFDDKVIVLKNPRIFQLNRPADIWLTSYWDSPDLGSEYRPMIIFSYALNYALNEIVYGPALGAVPYTYHMINILLHALVSVLAAWAVAAIFRRPLLGLLTGILFALHPVHTEAVAGIVGRAELMAAIGVFGALGAFGRIRQVESKRAAIWWTVVAGLAFAFGVFSKENTITLLGILPLTLAIWAATERRAENRQPFWPSLTRLMPTLAVIGLLAVAYLAARYSVLGGLGRSKLAGYGFLDNPAFNAEPIVRILTAIRTQGEYILLLIWPKTLIADFSYNAYPLSSSVTDTRVLIGIVILAAMLIAFVIGLIEAPVVAFGVAFYLITMSLTSNIPFPIGTIKAERLLYLPSFGFCLILALVFERLWLRLKNFEARTVLAVAFVLICSGYFARTVTRNPDWKNDHNLFKATVATAPNNVKARNNYAITLIEQQDYDAAQAQLNHALKVQPESAYALSTTATLYARKSDALLSQAEELEKAGKAQEAKVQRDSAAALDEKARESYEKCIRVAPDFAQNLLGYGDFLYRRNHYDQALAVLEQAHHFAPKNIDVLLKLMMTYWRSASDPATRKERLNRTIAYAEEVLKLMPGNYEAQARIGVANFELGNIEKAAYHLEKAISMPLPIIVPNDINVLGAAYYNLNNLDKAEKMFAKVLQLEGKEADSAKVAAAKGLKLVQEARKTGVRRGLIPRTQ